MYFPPTSTASPPFLFFSDFVLALWHVCAPPFPEMRTGRLVRDLGSCARVGAKERSSSSGVSSSHMDAGAISQRVIRDQQKLSSTHGQLGKQMGGDTSGTGEGRGFLKETVSLILTRQMCLHPCSPVSLPLCLRQTSSWRFPAIFSGSKSMATLVQSGFGPSTVRQQPQAPPTALK